MLQGLSKHLLVFWDENDDRGADELAGALWPRSCEEKALI